jgi:fructokinase
MRVVYGGVEGGGTKFNLVVGTGPDDIVDELRIPTTTPEETMERVVGFFRRPREGVEIAALGFASFGPVDLHPGSRTYGHITTTPKPGWQYADVVGTLRAAIDLPIGWETDVTGAALGEHRWGAAQDVQDVVYITVGTGIGGGALVNGVPVHGLLHPEMGHLLVTRLEGDEFPGICPFHGWCLEGVASGPALRARLGRPAEEFEPDDPVWELEARYLAEGLYEISHVLSPQRIVVGGGVAGTPGLLDRVRRHLVDLNRGYLPIDEQIDTYVVAPGLGGRAGTMGALELARRAGEGAAG